LTGSIELTNYYDYKNPAKIRKIEFNGVNYRPSSSIKDEL